MVEFYESERKFVVTDHGRGIPVDILVNAVMKKHVSTKFLAQSDTRNKRITGLHGRQKPYAVSKLIEIAGTTTR